MAEHLDRMAPRHAAEPRGAMRSIVVVGASLAGHHAAQTLRDLGYDGRLTVIGAEAHRPYDRFPLSKGYLLGRKPRHELDIPGEAGDVDWLVGRAATGLDLADRSVIVDDVQRVRFDGLVVATGARPRDADAVPGVRGAFVFRTVEDAAGLMAALDGGSRRVVVVGGGLIGAEVAATTSRGGHHTTLVDSAEVPTARSLGTAVAEHVLALHAAAGVQVRRRTRARNLDVRSGAVHGVLLEDGTYLPADVVVMATGTTPNVEWLRGSGLTTSGGLLCRPSLHAQGSSAVVAAGDVVLAPHPLLDGQHVRSETWAGTRDQAALAAANLLAGADAAQPLTALPEFGTTIHRARMRVVGFPQVADNARVVWGSVESGEAIVVLARGDSPVAAVSLNAHARLAQVTPQLAPGSSLDQVTVADSGHRQLAAS